MELLDKSRGPLPGGVANNRKFVVNFMRNRGFEIQDDNRSEYPEKRLYYLRGEHVGTSYDNVLYLHQVLPSLVEMGILAERRKTEIPFDLPAIEIHKCLQDAVKELKNSMASYDELVKKQRVQKIRRYFNDRKERQEMMEWMV